MYTFSSFKKNICFGIYGEYFLPSLYHGHKLDVFICLKVYIICIFLSLQEVSGLLDDLSQASLSTRLGL